MQIKQKMSDLTADALLRILNRMDSERAQRISHKFEIQDTEPKCQTSDLDDPSIIQHLRRQCDRQDSPFYAFHIFSEMSFCARKRGFTPTKVLEIGTGATLGSLFCFVAAGVERAVGVDVEPISGDRSAFHTDLKNYLACVGGVEWWRHYAAADQRPYIKYPNCWENVQVEELHNKIEYYSPVYGHHLPFDADSFDFAYSVAVLEHIDQPGDSLAELHRVLEPGALTVHEIDLRDHGSIDPVRFLTLSDEQYLPRTQKYGEGRGINQVLDGSWQGEVYCNRLRLSDWLELFEESGFEMLAVEPLCVIEESELESRQLADPFTAKTLDDLSVLLVRIVARCTK